MAAFTIRLADEQATQLDKLADRLDRSRAYLAVRAIEDYLVRESWQIAEIEAGLADADRDDFATPEAVAKVVAKYIKGAPTL
jgi:predicted transcriptional regulator